ncbi:uncharacterized protein RBU57_001333 isoform 1-T1 [Macrochelys suwanniensis]
MTSSGTVNGIVPYRPGAMGIRGAVVEIGDVETARGAVDHGPRKTSPGVEIVGAEGMLLSTVRPGGVGTPLGAVSPSAVGTPLGAARLSAMGTLYDETIHGAVELRLGVVSPGTSARHRGAVGTRSDEASLGAVERWIGAGRTADVGSPGAMERQIGAGQTAVVESPGAVGIPLDTASLDAGMGAHGAVKLGVEEMFLDAVNPDGAVTLGVGADSGMVSPLRIGSEVENGVGKASRSSWTPSGTRIWEARTTSSVSGSEGPGCETCATSQTGIVSRTDTPCSDGTPNGAGTQSGIQEAVVELTVQGASACL